MSASRAAKIWRRTRVGGLLAAVLVGMLAWADASERGAPVFWAAACILAGALYEVSSLARARVPRLGLALVPSALLVLLLVHRSGAGLDHGMRPSVPVQALIAALLAVTVDLILRLWQRGGTMGIVGVVTALSYLGVVAWHFAQGDELDPAGQGLLLWFLVVPAVWSMLDAFASESARRRFTLVGAASLWIVTPLASLPYVWLWHGTSGLAALLVLSKAGDIAGYYAGSLLGKTHPFPRISPGKTTAGCVASLVAGTVLGGVLSATRVLPPGADGAQGGILGGLLFGLAVNVAAQAGDLLESACKRAAGVKDSGTWFGPSGGVLDLVDSLLLSVPVGLAAWSVLFP